MITAVFLSYSKTCMKDANVFWVGLGAERTNFEIVLIYWEGKEGRAVVPMYTQCNHPFRSSVPPQEVFASKGDICGIIYPRTSLQYAMKYVVGSDTTHRFCPCFQK